MWVKKVNNCRDNKEFMLLRIKSTLDLILLSFMILIAVPMYSVKKYCFKQT